MGDIQVFLPTGKYKVYANDEKYGTIEIDVDVKGTEITYFEMQLKTDLDIDTNNYKQLYIEIIKECKNSIHYDDLSENLQRDCNGLIEDLNNDGIRELVFNYYIDAGCCCEIWTIKNNKPVRIFSSGLYFDDIGLGGYLDLMEFRGTIYLTQFDREILNDELHSEDWVFYGLTENGYEFKHELSCYYEYDEREKILIPTNYRLDDCSITEEEFFDICPEKVADIINLDGDTLDEDWVNSVSLYYYDVCFADREVDFETLLYLLEEADLTSGENLDLYSSFINNRSYEKYIDCYYGEPSEYAIIDIGGTESKELIISSQQDFAGYVNTLIFSYDDVSKEILLIDKISHFSNLLFSKKYKAIEFSEYESTPDLGESGFYVLAGERLEPLFFVGWDNYESGDFNYIRTANSSEEITEQQKSEYFKELENIVFTKIP